MTDASIPVDQPRFRVQRLQRRVTIGIVGFLSACGDLVVAHHRERHDMSGWCRASHRSAGHAFDMSAGLSLACGCHDGRDDVPDDRADRAAASFVCCAARRPGRTVAFTGGYLVVWSVIGLIPAGCAGWVPAHRHDPRGSRAPAEGPRYRGAVSVHELEDDLSEGLPVAVGRS